MTVRELIEELSKHRPDAEVLVTWETTFHTIDIDQIYLSADSDVVIDADANAYKERIMTQKGWSWTRRNSEDIP
jgi:hypothetical protein